MVIALNSLLLGALLAGAQPAGGPAWDFVSSEDGSTPIARHEAAFVGVGDRFYLLGGRGIKATSIFDLGSRTWSEGAPPPIELHHFQPVVYKGEIYVLGAMTGPYPRETPVPHSYVYDPTADQWRQGVEIPADRRRGGAGAALHGDVVYLAAGIGNGHIGDHKNWLDALHLDTGRWERLPDAPRARDHFQAVLADRRLYLLAGRTSNSPEHVFDLTIGEVDVYDLATGTWATLEQPLPTHRAGNAAILVGDEILVIGGESGAQESAHDEVQALDVETHEWREASSLRRGRHGTGVVRHAQALYTASGCGKRGGEPELDTLERLALPPAPSADQP